MVEKGKKMYLIKKVRDQINLKIKKIQVRIADKWYSLKGTYFLRIAVFLFLLNLFMIFVMEMLSLELTLGIIPFLAYRKSRLILSFFILAIVRERYIYLFLQLGSFLFMLMLVTFYVVFPLEHTIIYCDFGIKLEKVIWSYEELDFLFPKKAYDLGLTSEMVTPEKRMEMVVNSKNPEELERKILEHLLFVREEAANVERQLLPKSFFYKFSFFLWWVYINCAVVFGGGRYLRDSVNISIPPPSTPTDKDPLYALVLFITFVRAFVNHFNKISPFSSNW